MLPRVIRQERPIRREELDALRIDREAGDSERSSRWIWALAAVVLVVIAVGAAGAWYWIAGRAVGVRAVAVRETAGDDADVGTVLNASGYVTARRRATVSSKFTGKLTEVLVEEGMPVEAGQTLARLDDSHHRAAAELARSRLGSARRAAEETRALIGLAELTLQRTGRLEAEGVVGQAELDSARTELEALQARLSRELEDVRVAERELKLREVELADTVIRAPFAGVVISKDAQPGEMVSPVSAGGGFTRTGICTVVDMGSLEIEVDVNESYIARVRPGQKVEAVLDAYPDWRIPSTVITTIPAADRQKATVLVRIGFDELDPRILPDMGIKVAFLEAERAGAAGAPRRLVPRAAIRRAGGRDVVYVVRGGTVERVAVSLGAQRGEEVEVVSGLGAGELVVVEGPEDLADGDRVAVR